jgi:hypothetical protein
MTASVALDSRRSTERVNRNVPTLLAPCNPRASLERTATEALMIASALMVTRKTMASAFALQTFNAHQTQTAFLTAIATITLTTVNAMLASRR